MSSMVIGQADGSLEKLVVAGTARHEEADIAQVL